MQIRANDLNLEAELRGPAHGEPVLMIMGLGMQLVAWPPELIDALTALGYRTIVFDNRDIGLSSKFDQWGRPNLIQVSFQYTLGLPIRAPYLLADMADDAIGLMDALAIPRAHLVGVSMGGMIAQLLAARNPDRVISATLMMTSTGSKLLPGPTLRARSAMLSRPKSRDTAALVEHGVDVWRTIGSPAFRIDNETLRARVESSIRRSYHPQGMARQLVAISATPHRAQLVGTIDRPTLVVHGRKDPLLPVACGIDLARRIHGAQLDLIDGMGHDLPPALMPDLAGRLAAHFARA